MKVATCTESSSVQWNMTGMEFLRLVELLEHDVANYAQPPEVEALATEGRAYLDAQG